MIDYEEDAGKKLSHYTNLLDSKPYDYDSIYLPHDAKAGNFQTGRSTVEQFLAHYQDSGIQCRLVPKLKVQHGIEAARKMLPLCRFNQTSCYDGIEALRAYRRSWNELTKAFGKTPVHDWSSNGADAFRYFALVTQEHLQVEQKDGKVHIPIIKPPEYTLEQLFKENESADWYSNIIRI